MVVKITNEDFTHVILTIGDTFGDDVRGGAGGDGLGGSDVVCVDREAVLAGAEQRNCGVSDDQVSLGGLRVYVRD